MKPEQVLEFESKSTSKIFKKFDKIEKVTSELRGTHTLGTTPAQQEKERPLQRAPVWCRQSTLRRSSLNLLLLQNAREG